MTEKDLTNSLFAFYSVTWFGAMAKTAKMHGYALAVHGSMKRDLDVIAVPWTEAATDAETLLAALMENHYLEKLPADFGTEKPHRRKAYSMMLKGGMGGGWYVDLSIMPKA